MSVEQVEKNQQELDNWKTEHSEQQWQDADYLYSQAKELESSNLALAYRIYQRVHNLNPDFAGIGARIEKVSEKLKASSPELMRSSSSEATEIDSLKENPKNKVSFKNRAKNQITALQSKYQALPAFYRKPFFTFVFVPWLMFAFYQVIWASPRYESQSQMIVKQPDASSTMDTATAFLSGFTGTSANNDTQLVEAYILSSDMLSYLDNTIDLRAHYTSFEGDFFSRMHGWSSREDFLKYYLSHIAIEIDPISSVITLRTQGFNPTFAQMLNEAIVSRAEWYINSVGHQLANAQLEFIQREHEVVESKLQTAKTQLLNFQDQYNLLDPTAEGAALQQIAYSLESQLSGKRAELKGMLEVMSDKAPEVISIKRDISALETQLVVERQRIAPNRQIQDYKSVGELLAQYSDYKVQLEIATQAYGSSLVSLEKSRVEAYRQLQYLVTVESSTLPEDSSYPEKLYNLTLFAVILMMLFGIVRIIIATVKELD